MDHPWIFRGWSCITVSAVRKDETLTRILSFCARKLASELTQNGTIWLQINFWRRGFWSKFRCASFLISKKSNAGLWDKKEESVTNHKCRKLGKWFWWFSWLFSRPNNKNSTHIDAYNFSASPQPPKTIQTWYDNRKIGFSTWEVSKVHASFRTAGTVWTKRDPKEKDGKVNGTFHKDVYNLM